MVLDACFANFVEYVLGNLAVFGVKLLFLLLLEELAEVLELKTGLLHVFFEGRQEVADALRKREFERRNFVLLYDSLLLLAVPQRRGRLGLIRAG